jgi:orotidine-5'-phosphate decarboxylase
MKSKLKPAQRLIIPTYLKPVENDGRRWVRAQIIKFATELNQTGVCIEFDSALRACGYDLGDEVHDRGLGIFADMKLTDDSKILSVDGILLRELKPEFITVMCSTGYDAMRFLKAELSKTEVIGVTMLTDITEDDSRTMFRHSLLQDNILAFARRARSAGTDGVLCVPQDIGLIQNTVSRNMTINVLNTCPAWIVEKGGDNVLPYAMTSRDAILAGADRVCVDMRFLNPVSRRDAVMRTIAEIEQAIADRESAR